MAEILKLPYIAELTSWTGIGWIIAILAGLWGAMIGIGKLGPSELLFLLCGAIVLGKVGYETLRERTGVRIIIFTVCVVIVVLAEYGVVRWTNSLSAEAAEQQARLKKLDDIPRLYAQIQNMKKANDINQAKSQQQITDFVHANTDLKSSIEKKDAILASIAKQQFQLNFSPQVLATSEDSIDVVQIQNNGKTDIEVYESDVNGKIQFADSLPAIVTPTAVTTFKIQPKYLAAISHTVPEMLGSRVPLECTIKIRTLDKKRYSLSFTWFFEIKDGAISRSYVVNHQIKEIK